MIKKVVLPIIALIIVVALIGYYLNGGFSKVEVNEKQSTQKYIAGIYYEGPPRSREISAIFQQAGQLVESGEVKGNLGGIYYNNPSEAKGKLKAFIGVVLPDPNTKLPANYELRELPAGRPVLQARVKANYALIPGKAYPAIFEFAENQNITLAEEFFEEFLSKEEGVVEALVKK